MFTKDQNTKVEISVHIKALIHGGGSVILVVHGGGQSWGEYQGKVLE